MANLDEIEWIEPLNSWTDQEKWVWKQVQSGEIANFNREEVYGGNLDPKKTESWMPERILRPEFLLTVLCRTSFRNGIPHTGLRIAGAWFKAPLDISLFRDHSALDTCLLSFRYRRQSGSG